MIPHHMRDGLDFTKQDSVPAVRDRMWQPLTATLLDYIVAADRPVDDIVAWGRSQGHTGALIRHMLAWLSFTGSVHYVPAEGVWRVGVEPTPPLPGLHNE